LISSDIELKNCLACFINSQQHDRANTKPATALAQPQKRPLKEMEIK
jgi:hypothetical protein